MCTMFVWYKLQMLMFVHKYKGKVAITTDQWMVLIRKAKEKKRSKLFKRSLIRVVKCEVLCSRPHSRPTASKPHCNRKRPRPRPRSRRHMIYPYEYLYQFLLLRELALDKQRVHLNSRGCAWLSVSDEQCERAPKSHLARACLCTGCSGNKRRMRAVEFLHTSVSSHFLFLSFRQRYWNPFHMFYTRASIILCDMRWILKDARRRRRRRRRRRVHINHSPRHHSNA